MGKSQMPTTAEAQCGRRHHQTCPSKPKHCYYTAGNHHHLYECSAGETGDRPEAHPEGRRVTTTTSQGNHGGQGREPARRDSIRVPG
jgi:hypothetical protein